MEASSVPGRIVRSAETGATLGLVEEVLFDPVQRCL